MATFFSDHLSSDGVNKTAVDVAARHSAGIGHGRLRYQRATINTAGGVPAAADILRFFTLKTSDRIVEMYATGRPATAGTMDLGVHKVGSGLHDGAVVDADLFSSALALTSALNTHGVAEVVLDVLQEAGTVTNALRGAALWQMAGLASDPREQWDVTGTLAGSVAGTGTITLECFYTSGD